MKMKLAQTIRFFVFQAMVFMFAGNVMGQIGTPACTYCSGASLVPSLVTSTLGISNTANDTAAFASGKGSIAHGTFSTAFGFYSRAMSNSCFAAGYNAKAEADFSYAIGYQAEALYEGSFVFGKYIKASAANSIVIGKGYDGTTRFLNNTLSNSIMMGMGSTHPTLTITGATTFDGYGRVGIANPDPQTELDVNGTTETDHLRLTLTPQLNYVLKSDENGNATWADPKTLGIWSLSSGNAYFNGGNVGIGVSSPTEKLEVTGYTKTSSGYKVGTNIVINASRDYSGRNGAFSGNLTVTGTGNSSFVGNVGIGTTTPAERLEVAGWAKTSNGYKVGTSTVIDINRNFSGNNGTFSGTLSVTGTGNSTFAGNVGIGTTSPGSQLDITGTFTARTSANVGNTYSKLSIGKANSPALSYGTSYIGFNAERTSDNNWTVMTDNAHNGGAVVYGTIGGTLHFVTIPNTDPFTSTNYLTDSEIAGMRRMTITGDGNIGIGITNPSSAYKLSVAGKILAEELQIQLVQDWYDNVFKAEYNLMDLNELESYVKQNNHLPDVPSEAEVMENGIRVGEMNALLLKKVEELTLYVIEQQKEIEKLKKAIAQ